MAIHTLNKSIKYLFVAAAIITLSGVFSSCKKEEKASEEPGEEVYINYFAKNTMNIYYLWNEEIKSKIDDWNIKADPITQVKEARYSLSDGTTVDRWTTLLEDYTEFENSIAGEASGSYGFDFVLYYYDDAKDRIVPVVTYVLDDGPAKKAGLKRGDAILTINGKELTPKNYIDIIYNGMLYAKSCTITSSRHSSEIKLTAENMYEDPVLMTKTFDVNGKKVGYMIYNSFTAASCERLVEVCKQFKQENIQELILDLRYNTGGLVSTELLLASMLAPEEAVKGKQLYEIEIYNSNLSDIFDTKTYFKTDFEVSYGNVKKTLSTADANIGINKIYYLTGSSTASASESLICCMNPFLDSEIIGVPTSGKFCSGIIYPADDWYDDYKDQIDNAIYNEGKKYAGTWGLYVMIGRYADKDGNTISMPNGINPTISGSDNPLDGSQLGDANETLLSIALAKAGLSSARSASVRAENESTLVPSSLGAGRRIEGRILEISK